MKQIAASKASNKASFTLDPPYHWPNRSCYHWVNLPNGGQNRRWWNQCNMLDWCHQVLCSTEWRDGKERKKGETENGGTVDCRPMRKKIHLFDMASFGLECKTMVWNARNYGTKFFTTNIDPHQSLSTVDFYCFFYIVIIGLFQKVISKMRVSHYDSNSAHQTLCHMLYVFYTHI